MSDAIEPTSHKDTKPRSLARIAFGSFVFTVFAFLAHGLRATFHARDLTMIGDGQVGIRMWEVARASMTRGDGFPLWDRSICGGMPYLANPEAPVLSSLLSGWFGISGDVMARWLPTIWLTFAGFGTFLLSKSLSSSSYLKRNGVSHVFGEAAAVLAGAIFVSSGYFTVHFAAHHESLPIALLPWVLLLGRRGEHNPWAAVGCGALLAVSILEGGSWVTPVLLLTLCAVSVPRLRSAKGVAQVVRMLCISSVVMVALSAIKLFPAVIEILKFPRKIVESDKLAWSDFIPILVDRGRTGPFPPHPYDFAWYSAYVGPLAAGFAIAGAGAAIILKPATGTRRWDLVVLIVLGLFLSRGITSPDSPYAVLTKFPIFDQFRIPTRLLVLLSLGLALAAAVALEEGAAALFAGSTGRGSSRFAQMAAAGLLAIAALFAVLDPLWASARVHQDWVTQPPLPRTTAIKSDANSRSEPGNFVTTSMQDWSRFSELPGQNHGSIACNELWGFPLAQGLRTDGQEVTVDPPAKLTDVKIAANGYQFAATGNAPFVVHFNQRFDPGFHTATPLAVVRRDVSGRLELVLPAGQHNVQLAYQPRGFLAGVLTTGLGLVLLLGIWLFGNRFRQRRETTMRLRTVVDADKNPSKT